MLLAMAKSAPLTVLLILINVICFPATFGIEQSEVSGWMRTMTFVPVEIRGPYIYFGSLSEVMETGAIWRLLTPMLLHFGWLHIVFNLLWVWEIGRRIENVGGRWWYVVIVILTSLAANLTQYFMSGPSLFGGMSGVVFGFQEPTEAKGPRNPTASPPSSPRGTGGRRPCASGRRAAVRRRTRPGD